MPSESGPEQSSGGLHITVCPVIDFHFGLFLLTKYCTHPDKYVPPWVDELSEKEPKLVEELVSFWVERGLNDLPFGTPYFEYGELLVAAWRAGMTFAPDVDMVLDSLELTLAQSYETPPLDSEPAAIWDLVDRRLALLRNNGGDRKAYVDLVCKVWTFMKPYWEDGGRAAAERAVRELSARARPDMDLRTLLPGNHFLHKDLYQPQIARARARDELYVVPLGLSGAGQLYWSLPGMLIVGTGLENEEREVERRARAERAANRMKVLSDPTRVAILFELLRPSHHAATVTELASLFALSQPTVSVHVKLLRESGLVTANKEGNQVHYQADEATVRAYVGQALDDILGANQGIRRAPDANIELVRA